ncbi:hypothetical protein CARUB_v10024490mg, partial [Capsella rubella]
QKKKNILWNNMQFLMHAQVPILKLMSSHQGISRDISIDNLVGVLKSSFLFRISDVGISTSNLLCEIDGRFRYLVLLVKEWANTHDINNSKNVTFNSYSLSLLVIFHIQTYVPPVLPPLNMIYPKNAADDRKTAEESIVQETAANIARFKSANQSSLSDLLFSDINLKAQEPVVCPFTGRWENIRSNPRWPPKTYTLFVEDPFEQTVNAPRSVKDTKIGRIAQSLNRTISLHSQHHENSTHDFCNLRGQSIPWNQQVQQNWSQSYNTPNPPYWPPPTQSRPQQNLSQNNPRNLQGQPSVQGQTWPTITQSQAQQKSQNKNGNRPLKNTSAG